MTSTTSTKRWDKTAMRAKGLKLFARIHKQKHYANPNHEVHFMARELKGSLKEQEDNWLTEGIESLINGSYTPRFLKRWYFEDEIVDQLYLADRVLQHLLLQELKPTFPRVMNKNCYHLEGPGGVKSATNVILQALKEHQPQYIIRADIRSFYKSISHKLLIEEVNRHYQDPKVQEMLKNIILNPIETPNGCMNPDYGIALRGPLSQFFSGLFLKPLDDAFNDMDVIYVRYNDDLLILCQTKRQLTRCKQRMMKILAERRLKLSRKKTRLGHINRGFHFLGIHYPGTQPQDKATVTQTVSDTVTPDKPNNAHYLALLRGGGRQSVIRNHLSQIALFRTQGHCERPANRLNPWSIVGFLPVRSSII